MRTCLKQLLPGLLCLLLCGCFDIQDELTIHPDGSGQVRLVIHSTLPPEVTQILATSGNSGAMPIYPPLTEEEADRFFPENNFTTTLEESSNGDTNSITLTARFKDINALLASPYGHAHQLIIKPSPSGAWTLTAISAGEPLARAAQVNPTNDLVGFPIPNLANLNLGSIKERMRFEFRVVVPGEIKESNGKQDEVAVSWLSERAKCKDDEEFAEKMSAVMHATWSADQARFTPAKRVRLGLVPFAQLAEETISGTSAVPKEKEVLAATKFIPQSLQVTRTVDLSGSGFGLGSQTVLSAVVELPQPFAPFKWGKPAALEVTDASGADLIIQEQGNLSPDMPDFGRRYGLGGGIRTGAGSGKTNEAVSRQQLTMVFKAPEWRVKEIALIKGEIELQYPGGLQILKLTNAIPSNQVAVPRGGQISYPSEGREILDPRLGELGAMVRLQTAACQNGMTTISLQTGGPNSLVDAQVFDAEGRPWPTTVWKPENNNDDFVQFQIMVPGKPKPPFSLALCFNAGGAAIKVPFQLERVPVGGSSRSSVEKR